MEVGALDMKHWWPVVKITTGSTELNRMIGGGVESRSITEVSSLPVDPEKNGN